MHLVTIKNGNCRILPSVESFPFSGKVCDQISAQVSPLRPESNHHLLEDMFFLAVTKNLLVKEYEYHCSHLKICLILLGFRINIFIIPTLGRVLAYFLEILEGTLRFIKKN